MSVSAEHKNAGAGGRPNMDQPTTYEIRMRGHLDAKCNSWVDGAPITTEKNSER